MVQNRWFGYLFPYQPTPSPTSSPTNQLPTKQTKYRILLALLRLVILFAIASFLYIAVSLQIRSEQEAGWGLASSLPAIDNPAMQIPFSGVNVVLEQFITSEQKIALERLRENGFGWVRQRLDWAQMEPKPGHYQWQVTDEMLQNITSSGLIPIVVLDGSPAWARAPQDIPPTDNPWAPPQDVDSFADFAHTFAQRYRDQVRFYQIWDEPNIAPHWGNRHIDPVGYARLFMAASQAIRSADPDAVLLLAALAPTVDRGHTALDEVYFLERLYAANIAPYMDAVAVQPFGFGHRPDDSRQQLDILNFQRAALIRRTMIAAGDGETPIWAVRYGWNRAYNSPWRSVAPAQQARFAAEALNLAYTQWPWLASVGWVIDQPSAAPDHPEWGFALVEPDGSETSVAKSIHNWQLTIGPRPINTQYPISNIIVYAFLYLIAGGALLWRGWRAIHILPWRTWLNQWHTAPPLVHLFVWAALLFVYYLASWPLLLILCWLWGAILCITHPRYALFLAAMALPFYFQHKKLELIQTTWLISFTHTTVIWLSPVLVMQVKKLDTGRTESAQSIERKKKILFPNLRVLYNFSVSSVSITSIRQSLQRFHAWDWLAVGWLVVGGASCINLWHWPLYGEGVVDMVLVPLLLYASIRLFAKTERQLCQVTVALVMGGVLAAGLGLWSWFQGIGTVADGVQRLVGPHFSPNHTALYLERILFVTIGFFFFYTGYRRIWSLVVCIIVGVALLLTFSRGALLLGLPTGFALLAWYLRKPLSSLIRISILWRIIGLLGLLLVVILGLSLFGERLFNSATIQRRLFIWQTSLQLWWDHLLVGVGPGGFFWHYPAYILKHAHLDPNLRHPHNVWLGYATMTGSIGLVWLLIAIRLFFRQFVKPILFAPPEPLRYTIWLTRGLIAALIAGFVHAQVDAFMALADLASWNWMAWGIMVSLREREAHS